MDFTSLLRSREKSGEKNGYDEKSIEGEKGLDRLNVVKKRRLLLALCLFLCLIMSNNWKKTFYIIWSGELFSTLTSSIVGYAIAFWLSIETKSAEVLAYAMIAALLPQALLGMFTGVFIDRWSRKMVMICADGFIAFCTAILSLMFYLGRVEIWQVYILLAMRSVGSAFHTPAMQASIPLLAPEGELMRISGVNQVISSLSNIAGPALAAILISVMDMWFVLMFDIGGAIIACTALLFVVIPNPHKKVDGTVKKQNLWMEMKEGLSAIFEKKGLGILFIFDIIAMFFIIPVAALFPLITLNHFGGDTYDMSLIEIIWGVGALVGGAMLGVRFMKRMNKVMVMNVSDVITGITFFLTGFLSPTGFAYFVVLTAIGGVAGAMSMGAYTVVLQTNIATERLGRVFSIYESVTLVPAMIGLVATGFIADGIGITNAFVIAGIALLTTGTSLLCIPSVRKLGRITEGHHTPE